MLRLGAHMSVAGGLEKAVAQAVAVDSDALQVFTKNQNQWRARELTEANITTFRTAVSEAKLSPVVAHASYLINLASHKDDLWEKSIEGLRIELERCEALGIQYLVVHPGAHVGSGTEAGIARVIQALDRVHADLPGYTVQTLLETTAGQGTTLGATFEELQQMIAGIAAPERVGVCMDSCHIFVAGYDIRTPETYAEVMESFDTIIGLDKLPVFHFNDTEKELGSKRDRHAKIGYGLIGVEGFRNFMTDVRLHGKAALLETEKGDDLAEDREAIELLRSLASIDG